MIPKDLELLADLWSNIPILRMEFLEAVFERVNIFETKGITPQFPDTRKDIGHPAS